MENELASWVMGALQLVVIGGLWRVLNQQDKNTKSLADLREELPAKYTPQPVFEQHRRENREDIHNLRNDMHEHELKCPSRLKALS